MTADKSPMSMPSSSVGVQDSTFGSLYRSRFAERALHPFTLTAGHGAGVLGGDDRVRLRVGIERPVVVLLVLPVVYKAERAGAPVAGAWLVLPVRPAVRVDHLLPMAGVAPERGLGRLVLGQQPDLDVPGPQPVYLGCAILGGTRREHVLSRQQIQEPGQVRGRLLRADAEAAGRPVRVPPLRCVGHIELGTIPTPRQQELRRGDALHPASGLRERRHAVGPAPPDRGVAPGAGVPEPVVEPVVRDAAAHPEPVQDAEHQHQVPILGDPAVEDRSLTGDLHVAGERGDPVRVGERDFDGGRPGEFQGTALPGPQAEFEDHLEREPFGDQFPGLPGAGDLTAQHPVDIASSVQIRWHDGGQPFGIARLADDVGDQVVEVTPDSGCVPRPRRRACGGRRSKIG